MQDLEPESGTLHLLRREAERVLDRDYLDDEPELVLEPDLEEEVDMVMNRWGQEDEE